MRLVGLGACLLLASCGRIGFDLAARQSDASAPDASRPPASDSAVALPDTSRDAVARRRDATAPLRDASPPDASTPPADAADARVASPPDARPDGAFDAAAMDAAALSSDYLTGLPPLAADPTVDGALEPGLTAVALPLDHWSGGDPQPAGFSATFAIAWRPGGLYFFVRVVDPSRYPAPVTDPVWCGDSVELYVDHDGVLDDYSAPGTRQLIMAAPEDDTTPRSRGEVYANTVLLGTWNPDHFVAVPQPGGYTAEGFIDAADLGLSSWPLQEGQSVGVDISVNVSQDVATTGACTQRLGQYFLTVEAMPAPDAGNPLPYFNPSAFATPALVAE